MKKITLCGDTLASFNIIYDPADGEATAFAADELARYIKLACGAALPVRASAEATGEKTVYIGRSVNPGLYTGTGEEDWARLCAPGELRISGGEPRGTIYGVYAFLEDVLGWRFLAPDCEVLTGGDCDIPAGREEWHPVMEWRDVCSAVYWEADISCKRRINSSYSRDLDAKRGGSFLYPGRFVHTMESLLGVPQHTQPCFSDPANLEKCIENVRALLRANPDARIISVTQNDCNADEQTYCTCPECARIDAEEGSHAGTLLRFVNAVGEAIEEEFPRVSLITLAYLHTIKCPQITRPRHNVIMEFAPMTMCYAHPVDAECNRETVRDLEEWSRVCDRIYLWDYIVDFSFSVPVFPDFHLLRRNVRYYADHHVTGMFCEGDNYHEDGQCTDLCELRAYLLSRLLCDPGMSEETFLAHRRDFLLGYYGAGGEHIGRFVDIISQTADAPGHYIGCFNNPQTLFPVPAFLARLPEMEECWNKAEELASTPEEKSRCERSRLGYTYLKLLYAFDSLCAEGGAVREAILAENRSFYSLLKKYNVRPRGMSSVLPELTDLTQNAATGIYWSPEALATLGEQ